MLRVISSLKLSQLSFEKYGLGGIGVCMGEADIVNIIGM